jgi:hypothetical protein
MDKIFELETPAADKHRDFLFGGVQQVIDMSSASHGSFFDVFWHSPDATPDEIILSMGTEALRWLMLAQQSAGNLGTVATIIGKTLDDLLPPSKYQPLRAFVIEMDTTQNPPVPTGRVTLAP